MKKLCFVLAITIFSFTSVNAQEGFSGGIHIGVPTGDFSDLCGIRYGVDLYYLFKVADNFDAGFIIGYTNFSGKDLTSGSFILEVGDAGFIPVAATARYSFSESIFGASDLGYGISTQGGTEGFYYQPKAGWQNDAMDVFAFYKGISSDGVTIASFGIGTAFRL